MAIVHVTNDDFHATLDAAQVPVLVDFWAAWCGPCRMLAPLLEQLDEELAGKLQVAKLNVDEQERIAREFNVQSIPLLILFKDGEAVDQHLGLAPKDALLEWLEPHLG